MLNKTRLVLLVAILSAAAGAVVFKTPPVLFLLATLLAAPVLSSAVGAWMSRGLRVSRQMPLVGSVGDELRARITVRNGGQIPALLVHAQGGGAGEEQSGVAAWRRRARAGGVASAQHKKHPLIKSVGATEVVGPLLWPGASFSGEVAWKLLRRGVAELPGARAGTVDPISLSEQLSARSAPVQLLILPRPLKLRALELGGGSASTQRVLRPTRAPDAAEVHGVRPYQPGEGGRRIHWRATARTGQLHVIDWEEESASELTILLDVQAHCVAGLPGEDTLESAITAAASVAAFLLESGQRARLFWWQDDVAAGEPRLMRVESRHQNGLPLILAALARLVPCHNSGATLDALSARVRREGSDQNVLLLASDRAPWREALAPWQPGRSPAQLRGLAFDCASFEEGARAAVEWRARPLLSATLQRVAASKNGQNPALPAGVQRIGRADALVDVLEKRF